MTAGAAERHTTAVLRDGREPRIYHKGWTAVTKHRTPWTTGAIQTVDDDVWEMYDTSTDWTRATTSPGRCLNKNHQCTCG